MWKANLHGQSTSYHNYEVSDAAEIVLDTGLYAMLMVNRFRSLLSRLTCQTDAACCLRVLYAGVEQTLIVV